MMTRMLGLCCCWAVACGLATIMATNNASTPLATLLPIYMIRFLPISQVDGLQYATASDRSERIRRPFSTYLFSLPELPGPRLCTFGRLHAREAERTDVVIGSNSCSSTYTCWKVHVPNMLNFE